MMELSRNGILALRTLFRASSVSFLKAMMIPTMVVLATRSSESEYDVQDTCKIYHSEPSPQHLGGCWSLAFEICVNSYMSISISGEPPQTRKCIRLGESTSAGHDVTPKLERDGSCVQCPVLMHMLSLFPSFLTSSLLFRTNFLCPTCLHPFTYLLHTFC